jgi:hypothetical protein
MKLLARRFITVALLAGLMLVLNITPAHSYLTEFDLVFDFVECIDEGNNAHVNASIIRPITFALDAVCPDDPFDWYLLPIQGDLGWHGSLICIAKGPGIVFRLYADTGSGLNLLKEESPVVIDEELPGIFALVWDFEEIALNLGHTAAPSGNYYIRVSYYSNYAVDHPYLFMLMLGPVEHEQSDANIGPKRLLPPGMMHYGHVDAVNTSDLYKFTLEQGQDASGIIALTEATRGLNRGLAGLEPDPGDYELRLSVYNPSAVKIATAYTNAYHPAVVDLNILANTPPGQYMIEVAMANTSPVPDDEYYYMLFDHALAPGTGDWSANINKVWATSLPLQEGVPVEGTYYGARDIADFYSFSSDTYFLGDIFMRPLAETRFVNLQIFDKYKKAISGSSSPGLSESRRISPLDPGDYYAVLRDPEGFIEPVDTELTLFPHGMPITSPMGYSTWQTAMEIEARDYEEGGQIHHKALPFLFADLKLGVQDALFGKIIVPEEKFLAGYFEIYGSRPEYNVSIGKLGPGSTPLWSPALTPAANGKLVIDMDYEYLADPGEYYLRMKIPSNSPGQTRILLENQARLTECVSDDNDTFYEAVNLRPYYTYSDPGFGQLCPTVDNADWYYFYMNDYDTQVGPNEKLIFKGGAPGMRIEFYDSDMVMKFSHDLTSAGETVDYALKSYTKPNELYRVKVEANPSLEKVQVYELKIAPILRAFPMPFEFKADEGLIMKISPEAFKILKKDDETEDRQIERLRKAQ